MKFDNLTLSGWSYEKGDHEIPVDELNLPSNVLMRNPVSHTFVYSDTDSWKESLRKHSRRAVEMAGIKDDDIQAFFGVHNGVYKHPEGASPEVMSEFPGNIGFGFDFSLGCASVILGAQLAGLHMNQDGVRNVVLGSVQLTTQYTNSCTDGNCLFADSIGAMTFSKSESGHKIRYTEVTTNSEFRDMFVMNKEGIYQLKGGGKGRALSEFMIKTYADHMRKACLAMKIFPKDIDYVAISCSTYAASKMVLDKLKIPLEKSGIECLKNVPHMGTNDLIYQIEYGIEKGLIKEGSRILVTGTSLGFSMATMAIEW